MEEIYERLAEMSALHEKQTEVNESLMDIISKLITRIEALEANNDPCDRCDGEGEDCQGCSRVREWLKGRKK